MTKRQQILIRLLIASLAGMLIFGLSIRVAWQGIQTNFRVLSERYRTLQLMENLTEDLNEYREKHGEFPPSLLEFKLVMAGEEATKEEAERSWIWSVIDEEGMIRDAWDHPMVYRIEGDSILLLSYGRDGLPGGLGLDHDFSNQDPFPPAAKPTFEQFLYELPTDMMIFTCVMAGVFTSLLIFRAVNPVDLQAKYLPWLFAKLIMVLLVTWLFAVPMSLLHAPSGH